MKLPSFLNSIRWRLVVWMGFLLALVLGGFGFTAYHLHRRNQLDQIDSELEERLAYLSETVRRPPLREPGGPGGPGRRPPPEFRDFPSNEKGPRKGPPGPSFGDGPVPFDAGPLEFRDKSRRPRDRDPWFQNRQIELPGESLRLFDDTDTNGFYFGIWSRGGRLLKGSSNVVSALVLPPREGRDTTTHVQTRDGFREAYHFTEIGECILAGVSLAPHFLDMRLYLARLSGAGLSVLALGLAGAWWLATRSIKPVDRITATANRIAEGNLSERIESENTVMELSKLASVLNSTFSRLEAAFEQQKQFTADASHELRTPLAVIISESQSALHRPRSPEEYREALKVCQEAAQQMRTLSDSLLQLARFDAAQELPVEEPVDIGKLAEQSIQMVRGVAQSRDVSLHCKCAEVLVLGDAMQLTQVITNLLQNAIFYNKPGGKVSVETLLKDNVAVITVSDTGVGIQPEDLPNIFKRFYRADKARARSEGHTGLGLAIAKTIIERHGGTIEVSSVPGEGSCFTLTLPPCQPSMPEAAII